jgi:hypothetical protein
MGHHFVGGARIYLSGPMDFGASSADENKLDWRNRVGDYQRPGVARGLDLIGIREKYQPPQNPLLPFLERLAQKPPQPWDDRLKKHVPNDDWLFWELQKPGTSRKES